MLPRLVPMLAVSSAPFDSPEYSFEIQWNGVRALAAVEGASAGVLQESERRRKTRCCGENPVHSLEADNSR